MIGWNSWNTFKANVNQSIIEITAARLISSGLAAAGYSYVIIDEGWQAFSRDANGRQQANATKFPSGIERLADSIHTMGLKLGIYRYTSRGPKQMENVNCLK
jgi:alpha-galactosidase